MSTSSCVPLDSTSSFSVKDVVLHERLRIPWFFIVLKSSGWLEERKCRRRCIYRVGLAEQTQG